MFFDLHTPWPSPSHAFLSAAAASSSAASGKQAKRAKKGKDKDAGPAAADGAGPSSSTAAAAGGVRTDERDCWWGVADSDRQRVEEHVQLTRHLGYNVLAFTQTAHTKLDPQRHYNPFRASPGSASASPFPALDPLGQGASTTARGADALVQLSRLHIVLEDASLTGSGPGFSPQNQALLGGYDILSVQPTTLATFTHACLSLTTPGPSQVSLITLSFPDTARGLPFYLKRKPVLQAIRNGAFFEIPYAPLLPSFTASTPAQTAQARRNTLSLARDLVRITKGRGIVLSSGGPAGGGEWGAVRAPGDVVNLGTLMGLSPEKAHDAVVRSPKSVVLRAQTRKTFKGLLSVPQVVVVDAVPAEADAAADEPEAMVVG